MATVTSLNSYSFAFNGFVFGGGNSAFQILNVDGLDALPAIRNQDDNRGYQDGMFTGRDFLSGRSIIMQIQVLTGSYGSLQAALQDFYANIIPQQQGTGVLQFQIPGRSLQRVDARVRRRSAPINPDYTYGKALVNIEFFCPSPLYFDDTLKSTDLYNGTTIQGRTYNRVYNLVYGSGSQGNNLITNNGYATAYPLITITGPANVPTVQDITTGQFLKINYNLVISDTLVIDTNLRTVTINGVNRRALLDNSSSWFNAPPGTSFYTFTATAGSTGTGTSCVVTWRNAYI
jgi:hypothetical protein